MSGWERLCQVGIDCCQARRSCVMLGEVISG